MAFHHVLAAPFSCGSIMFVQPVLSIRDWYNIDSALCMNRTGSSGVVPWNSGNEYLAVRTSSYGISIDCCGPACGEVVVLW